MRTGPIRFSIALLASAALHLVVGLLLYFDVVGEGGGFGIGSGPGIGIGQGGGIGLGVGKRRQIYALRELPAAQPMRPRRGKLEDQLAQALEPQAVPRSAMAVAGDLAVAMPKAVALPPPSSKLAAELETKAAAGAFSMGGLGGAGGGGGFGVSLGLSSAFGRYVSELRSVGLEIVFLIDGTASMNDVIAEVRRDLGSLVGTIQSTVPVARIGFVVYRDRADAKPIELAPLTYSQEKLAAFLRGIEAEGGGDWPESLNLAFEAARDKMSWRPGAKRLIVFVASSPPHDDERQATIDAARALHAEGGAVSAVDLSVAMHEVFERKLHRWLHDSEAESIPPLPEYYREVQATFQEIVRAGGGELIPFKQGRTLVNHLMVLAFGTKWQKEVEAISKQVKMTSERP